MPAHISAKSLGPHWQGLRNAATVTSCRCPGPGRRHCQCQLPRASQAASSLSTAGAGVTAGFRQKTRHCRTGTQAGSLKICASVSEIPAPSTGTGIRSGAQSLTGRLVSPGAGPALKT
jgi:hypothetical protein